MIVADTECRTELQGYLPFSRGGVGAPGTGEEQKESRSRRGRGPSAFIPVEEVLREGAESLEQHLGLEALMSSGRVDNLAVVMGLHPDYLSSFWRLHYLLLHTDGPLASSWRHYIAIMAAARHQCSYLVGSHMAEFLQTGGDPEWLLGLHRAPEKLRKLSEINKLLAHRPWLITKEHIQALLKTGEHSWSLAELIQALVLLTHCHSLASFVFGCGILPEGDPEGSPAPQAPSPPSEQSSPPSGDPLNNSGGFEAARDVEALMERMRQLQESLLRDEGASQEEMESRFELEKSESLLVTPSGLAPAEVLLPLTSDGLSLALCSASPCPPLMINQEWSPLCSMSRPHSDFFLTWSSADILEPSPHPDMLCFVEDPTFGYEDFTRRGAQAPPTFRAQDYTWEDHGYSLIQRLYPEGGQLLDEKFQAAYSLTYNTIAMHSGVDTSMLRRAIWNYIHCVFGIRYDDYDYGEVNQLLERNLKVYIKTVACYPEKTTRRMYNHFWRHFRHSEKVHVNLLLLEARMQAALLYALRAITRYMT
ncbi:sestrin-2 isoform X1 [Marmota marmota marmota]|nr:sestrin-2 isoform X1 [Marmota marmota marmota]